MRAGNKLHNTCSQQAGCAADCQQRLLCMSSAYLACPCSGLQALCMHSACLSFRPRGRDAHSCTPCSFAATAAPLMP